MGAKKTWSLEEEPSSVGVYGSRNVEASETWSPGTVFPTLHLLLMNGAQKLELYITLS